MPFECYTSFIQGTSFQGSQFSDWNPLSSDFHERANEPFLYIIPHTPYAKLTQKLKENKTQSCKSGRQMNLALPKDSF